MDSSSLFFRRLRQNWKYHYNIFKTIVDWTVMLYILIPTAAITLVIYHGWWNEMPQWIELVPFPLMFALLFLFIWGGHFCTFVREADRVFLMKNKALYINLKRYGILNSYVTQVLNTVLLGLLVAPFWLGYYQVGVEKFALYLYFFLSSKWLIMGVKSRLNVHLRGWRSLIRSVPLYICVAIIWILYYYAFQINQIPLMIGLILLNTLGSAFFVSRRFNSVKTFEQDLAIDESERNKYISLIFSMSMDIEKPPNPIPPRKSPILYSKSNRLFNKRSPRNGLLELFIKVNTRNPEYVFRYIQIIGVTSVAIVLIPPFWYKLAIGIFGLFFMRTWIRSVWDQIIGNHSFTMKYVNNDAFLAGKRIVTFIFSLLFVILISLSLVARSWIFI